MNKYKPGKGAQFNEKQAQAIGRTLERIGFTATPKQFVDESRKPGSPTHDLFDWDTKRAAESHWIHQARNYINHLEVVVITDAGPVQTKAFHSVVVTYGDKKQRGYCSLETVVEHEDLTQQVVRKALQELSYWKAKYAEYKSYPELAGVFSAIESATKPRPVKRKRQRTVA